MAEGYATIGKQPHSRTNRHEKIKAMHIQMHDGGGYTIRHEHEQSRKGEYIEDASAVHGHHGTLMDHIHHVLKNHGTDQKMTDKGQETGDMCEYCGGAEESGSKSLGSGGTGKKDLGGKRDYA